MWGNEWLRIKIVSVTGHFWIGLLNFYSLLPVVCTLLTLWSVQHVFRPDVNKGNKGLTNTRGGSDWLWLCVWQGSSSRIMSSDEIIGSAFTVDLLKIKYCNVYLNLEISFKHTKYDNFMLFRIKSPLHIAGLDYVGGFCYILLFCLKNLVTILQISHFTN